MRFIPLEGRYLIQLLAAVLHGYQPAAPPAGLDWLKMYQLAVFHDVANTVYYPLEQLKEKPPENIRRAFREARNKAVRKEAKQELEVVRILSLFEHNQIKCLPLKGYLIKQLYPRPDMRLMADVDILLQEGDLEKAKPLMLSLGYQAKLLGYNHDVYYKPPVMNIELHRALIGQQYEKFYAYYGSGWQVARLKEHCQYIYEMSPEDFYIYLVAHLAKHYQQGGTGIRSIMDIWVYLNCCGSVIDRNYIDREFKKLGLLVLANNLKKLSASWFDGGESSEFLDKMTAFILFSGVYGSKKNSCMTDMMKYNTHQSFEMAKAVYTLRLFLPERQFMKVQYSILNKMPFLLPVTWILRGLGCVLFKPQNIVQKLRSVAAVNKQEAQDLWQLNQKAGL